VKRDLAAAAQVRTAQDQGATLVVLEPDTIKLHVVLSKEAVHKGRIKTAHAASSLLAHDKGGNSIISG
jgi:hypothetical protein